MCNLLRHRGLHVVIGIEVGKGGGGGGHTRATVTTATDLTTTLRGHFPRNYRRQVLEEDIADLVKREILLKHYASNAKIESVEDTAASNEVQKGRG